MDYQGKNKLVFSLTDPKSCVAKGAPVRIHIEPKRHCNNWDFEICGSFADRNCRIIDCTGKIVAQVCHLYLHNPLGAKLLAYVIAVNCISFVEFLIVITKLQSTCLSSFRVHKSVVKTTDCPVSYEIIINRITQLQQEKKKTHPHTHITKRTPTQTPMHTLLKHKLDLERRLLQ
jgi:hypothetical protein